MKTFLVCSLSSIAIAGLSTALGMGGGLGSPFLGNTLSNALAADNPLVSTGDRTATTCTPAAESADSAESSELAATSGLMLLTTEGMGQTISTRPTFFWFSQETSAATPTLFRLYEYDAENETYTLLMASQSMPERNEAGIMALSLPQDMAMLSVGQRYLWQVEVACDRTGTDNLIATAEFEVVEPSTKMMDDLIASTTMAERTDILAAESLWYDALSMMFLATATGETSQDMAEARQALLEQVAASANEQAQLESSPMIRQDLVLIPLR